jgi:hypothetical protein
MIKNIFLKNQGQILVETMVALSMVVIGLLGLLSLLTYSIGLNKIVSDQYVGSYLAAEGIEIIKNIIDTNIAIGDPYNQGLSSGSYEVDYKSQQPKPLYSSSSLRNLKFDGKRYTYSPNPGSFAEETPFTRKIEISYNGDFHMIVKSTVSWSTKGVSQSLTLEDHFFGWR